jgi:hypothetical protein
MSYSAQMATAKAVLGRRGARVTLQRKHQGAINAIAGTRAAGSTLTAIFNCVGLPLGASKSRGKTASFTEGLIESNVLQFYMARVSGSLDPEPGDIVPWGGKNYVLTWTATYDPDNSGTIFTSALGEIAR